MPSSLPHREPSSAVTFRNLFGRRRNAIHDNSTTTAFTPSVVAAPMENVLGEPVTVQAERAVPPAIGTRMTPMPTWVTRLTDEETFEDMAQRPPPERSISERPIPVYGRVSGNANSRTEPQHITRISALIKKYEQHVYKLPGPHGDEQFPGADVRRDLKAMQWAREENIERLRAAEKAFKYTYLMTVEDADFFVYTAPEFITIIVDNRCQLHHMDCLQNSPHHEEEIEAMKAVCTDIIDLWKEGYESGELSSYTDILATNLGRLEDLLWDWLNEELDRGNSDAGLVLRLTH